MRKKSFKFRPGVYGDWLMVVEAGAMERGDRLGAKGQQLIDMQGSSRRELPADKEMKEFIKTWAEPITRSPNASKKLKLVKNGCFAVYFSNGDGKTFTGKYICQTNL